MNAQNNTTSHSQSFRCPNEKKQEGKKKKKRKKRKERKEKKETIYLTNQKSNQSTNWIKNNVTKPKPSQAKL